MPPLNAEQLQAVQRLLLEPLRDTIKAELQVSLDRLASSIDRLAEEMRSHRTQTEHRIEPLERELARQKRFRRKLAGIYGVIAVLLSAAWALIREKIMRRFGTKE